MEDSGFGTKGDGSRGGIRLMDGEDIACCPLEAVERWLCRPIAFSLCLRSSCSGVMHFTGGGIGASGELLPISFGLGSSLCTGGKIGAPAMLPAVAGRGDCLVGLRPDSRTC